MDTKSAKPHRLARVLEVATRAVVTSKGRHPETMRVLCKRCGHEMAGQDYVGHTCLAVVGP